MRTLRRPLTTVAVVATLAIAGCGGDDDGPTLRTTAVEAPGTPVTVERARIVVPSAWVEDPALATKVMDAGPAGLRVKTFVLRTEKDAPKAAAAVLVAREPGVGKLAVDDTDRLAKNFKSGFDSTSGLQASQSKVGPKTELGGQPAGTLLIDTSGGGTRVAARGLVTGRDDQTYGVTAFGAPDHQAQVDDLVTAIQKSWSWR